MTQGICILDASRHRIGERDGALARLYASFGVPVRRLLWRVDLARAFEPSRGQHNATVLVQQVQAHAGGSRDRFLAVVDVDLFIPVLSFVFGQAQLDGPAGIISTYRLANEYYGLPEDPRLLHERVIKEIVHELGHQFGLYHCHQFECVMRSSTYVEEIDLKRAEFCPDCRSLVQERAARSAGQGSV